VFSKIRLLFRGPYAAANSLVCLAVGQIKARLLFDKDKTNKLEIGLGPSRRKEGFITSDLSLQTDYPYDLRFGLPFTGESLDLICAEHVFEHFHYRDLVSLLASCYRTLKPGGILSLVVPDARIYLNAYFHPDGFDRKKFCAYDFGLSYKSKIDYVNYIFYMDGQHHYMFDQDSIRILLEDAGFKDARLRSFDPALDQKAREYASIYAQAVK
jgi:predicted SAM-dependent methyltransferase